MQIHLQNSKKNELVAYCVESRVTSVAKNDEKISLQGFKDILILLSGAVSGCCLVCERFMTLHLELGLQPTSASCQGSSPNLLLVEHLQDLFIATEASVEQCRCMNQRKWENQNSISTYVSDSKKIFLSCRHPTKIPSPHRVPPQSNGIRMEVPEQVK